MALETFNYIDSLVATNPVSSDSVGDGDNHIRGIKTTLGNTFPNITGAITSTQAELNYLDITTLGTVEASKAVTADASGDVKWGDSDKATFGDSNDLQIYHDSHNSYITDEGAGTLRIRSSNQLVLQVSDGVGGWENALLADDNGAVTLRHNNSNKLATTSTGIDVTGTVTADGLTVDGSVELNSSMVDLSTEGWSNLPLRIDASDSVNNTGYVAIGFASSTLSGFGYSTGALRHGTTGYGSYQIRYHGANDIGIPRVTIGNTGDISFYEDTGTTAKFHWDAADERLGIGTSSPSAVLDVNSSVNGTQAHFGTSSNRELIISSSASGGFDDALTKFTKNSSVGEFAFLNSGGERLRIDSSGNMGLGVTPESWKSDVTALQFGASSALYELDTGTTDYTQIAHNVYRNTSGQDTHINTAGAAKIWISSDGGIGFVVTPSGTADTAISWTTAMTIANDGKLTIGSDVDVGTNTGYANDESRLLIKAADPWGTDPGIELSISRNSNTDGRSHPSLHFTGNHGTGLSENHLIMTLHSSFYSDEYVEIGSGNNDADLKVYGNGTCDGSWTGGGADYAEYLEWSDGNATNEDRRGFSVVFEGDKIRPALAGEEPFGVISARPAVVGDGDIDRWKMKYLRDDFGAYIFEPYPVTEWDEEVIDQEAYTETVDVEEVTEERQVTETVETGSYVNLAGETIVETEERGVTTEGTETVVEIQEIDGVRQEVEVVNTIQVPVMETVVVTPASTETVEHPATYKTEYRSYHTDAIPADVTVPADAVVISADDDGVPLERKKLNPAYDETQEYISREDRQEWDTVGLMGKLRIRKGQPTASTWIKMRDVSDSVEEWLVK